MKLTITDIVSIALVIGLAIIMILIIGSFKSIQLGIIQTPVEAFIEGVKIIGVFVIVIILISVLIYLWNMVKDITIIDIKL
jgi:hypothetical protein